MRTVTPRIKPDKWSRHISSWIYRPRPQLHKPTNALKCTNHPMNNAQTIQCTNHPIQEKNPNSWLLQAFWFSATVTCKFCCPNFVGFPLFSQQILLGPHCHLIFGLHEGFPQNESCWVLFFRSFWCPSVMKRPDQNSGHWSLKNCWFWCSIQNYLDGFFIPAFFTWALVFTLAFLGSMWSIHTGFSNLNTIIRWFGSFNFKIFM